MYPTGKNGTLQPFSAPVHTEPGHRVSRKQKGFWENKQGMIETLLCGDCEQRFNKPETYVKRFFYGHSNPIRFQAHILQNEPLKTDYTLMKLFQLSILWRASEAKGSFYKKVTIADFHRERLRQMLLNDNPGKDFEYCCGMVRSVACEGLDFVMKAHDISIETGIFEPVSHQGAGWQTFLFSMGGLWWLFCVSDSKPPEMMANSYMDESGQLPLPTRDGWDFLYQFSHKAVAAGNITYQDVLESELARQQK